MRIRDIQLAINVLKHGWGKNYDAIASKTYALPFGLKRPEEHFYHEGEVSEIHTLIEVSDAFVQQCSAILGEVSEALRRGKHVLYI